MAWLAFIPLMTIIIHMEYRIFGQAYGVDSYGKQQYSCAEGDTACIEAAQTSTETTAPNTGFMGMPVDAALGTAAGALLVTFAVLGAVYVVVGRIRHNKKQANKD